MRILSIALLLALIFAGPARAQCMLANPSFEIGGSAGNVFGGWNQFGAIGSTTKASHGALAARASGPNTGNWDMSGFWQSLDCAPGQKWNAAVDVRVPSTQRLLGNSKALLNIEWRNSGGGLISYESHVLADSGTARDTALRVLVQSLAAPAGTTAARFLVGVLQGPGDPVGSAYFDRATFEKITVPTLAQLQWSDFNGGRTVSFSGRTWRVKGPGYYGPGPNLFADGASHVFTDANGRLHLTIKNVSGSWYSTEVALTDTLGYGDYVFTTYGRVDQLDLTTVLGLFIWEYGPCYDPGYLWWNPYNEIDVELGRWGAPGNPNAQFVAQPYDWAGNRYRYDVAPAAGERMSHAFRWMKDRVEFRAWNGGPLDESPASTIVSWTYTGPHIPRPDQPRVHLNLWQFSGPPASDQEVVLDAFTFVPLPGSGLDAPAETSPPRALALAPAWPNPMRGATTLRWALPAAGPVSVEVFDPAGRRVRTLLDGWRPAGTGEVTWDGRGAGGERVAPGVYLCRLHAGAAFAVRRLVVLE